MTGKFLFRGLVLTVLFTCSFTVMADNLTLTVEAGDTLYSIGRTYRVSVQELIQVNGIVNPRALKKGMRITVPRTYVIEKGDTLYGIARENGLSVEELSTYNDIEDSTLIKVGQIVLLPAAAETDIRVADGADGTDGADAGRDVVTDDDPSDGNDRNGQGEDVYVPAVYKTEPDDVTLIWPHEGSRSRLNGKLKGTEILGQRGDRVYSVSSGEVVWVAPYRGYGTLVMVETGDK
ncbi:MAG: LysM peptidoglycan-binding domain-containing protein, partial [Sediminispirochaetaceae bacterium]